MSSPTHVDVVVVGGGPAGAAAAIPAARAGLRVLLIHDATRRGAVRPETLPGAAGPILARLTGRPEPPGSGHRRGAGVITTWGGRHPVSRPTILEPCGGPWHVDRSTFDVGLREFARASGVDIWPGRATRVERVTGTASDLTVQSADGGSRVVRARTVVDATGRRASIARRFGARRRSIDRLACVSWSLELSRESTRDVPSARVTACADGWWFGCAGPGTGGWVSRFTDVHLLRSSFETIAATRPSLPEALGDQFGEGWIVRQRAVTDARTARLDPVAGPGWAAVGDAAGAFDPLSSQGLVRALATGESLGRSLAQRSGEIDVAGVTRREILAWDRFLHERSAVYGREFRWPDAPFWRCRRPFDGRAEAARSVPAAL